MAGTSQTDLDMAKTRFLRTGPLLQAIAREIRERSSQLLLIEAASSGQGSSAQDLARKRLLDADAAVERRELERATRELENMGCTIVGWAPLTVAIERNRRRSLWMLDDPK